MVDLTMTKKMHLGSVLLGTGSHTGGWRMPEAEFGSQNLGLLKRVCAMMEAAKFDFVFFADAVNSGLDAHPGMMVRFEPLALLSHLAGCTSKLGLVATVSTTYSQPYNVARSLATIDHISGGRAGWNVVTSASEDAAKNFGLDHHPGRGTRYDMAEEYLEVTKGLWNSWEENAIIGDKATGRFADSTKMHVLNHDGPHYKVRGPLNITRPPQGYPVIFQAGASDRGIGFAGRTADVIFTAQQIQSETLAFRAKISAAAVAAGRAPDAIKIMAGVCPIIGQTRADAYAKLAELGGMLDPIASARVLSDRIGYDISQFDLDAPFPDLPMTEDGTQGHAKQLLSLAKREKLSLRQLRDYAAASSGHRLVIGSPEEIADDLEDWFRSGAVDGFAIMSTHLPGPLEEFTTKVVPILVSRGLFRADYHGDTLREHLDIGRPDHPARTVHAAE
jgi:FMN-dependent oxidoreductase (nitrilotriacetate monooxygenase family)